VSLLLTRLINKHYFLDLAPGRSMVEYLVGRGVHYFTIIWPQPAARARPLGHG
jgi:polyhydroxyalkanoate synthase subunit PhaC